MISPSDRALQILGLPNSFQSNYSFSLSSLLCVERDHKVRQVFSFHSQSKSYDFVHSANSGQDNPQIREVLDYSVCQTCQPNLFINKLHPQKYLGIHKMHT